MSQASMINIMFVNLRAVIWYIKIDQYVYEIHNLKTVILLALLTFLNLFAFSLSTMLNILYTF